MRYFLSCIILMLCLFLSGCQQSSIPQDNNTSQSTTTKDSLISSLECSNELSNVSIARYGNNGYLISAGQYLYHLDLQNKMHVLRDVLISEDTKINSACYNNDYIYMIIFQVNKENFGNYYLARMKENSDSIEYLFNKKPLERIHETHIHSSYKMQIYNHYLYIIDNDNVIVYVYDLENSLQQINTSEISIQDYRKEIIQQTYSQKDMPPCKYIYNNNIYYYDSGKKAIIQYSLTTQETTDYSIKDYVDIYSTYFHFELLDECWYIYSTYGIYQMSIDFSQVTTLVSKDDMHIYYNNINNDGAESIFTLK